MICVCVTGAGAPGIWGTLECLRHNPDNEPVEVIGVDVNPDASGKWFCDRFAVIDPPSSPVYGDVLLKAIHGRATVVLPQCTDELERLAGLTEMFAAWGITIAVSPPEVVAKANHKAVVLMLAGKSGIPTPNWEVFDGVVLRPTVGHGSKGLHRFFGDYVATDYLPGPEYTVDGFTGQTGSVAVVRKRHAMRTGISTDTEVIRYADLEAQSVVLAQALGLRYAWGFQFKEDADGVPRLLECNPRIQGTMVASAHAGVNIPWLCVREATGWPVETLPEPRPGRFVRYWGGQWFGQDAPSVIAHHLGGRCP
jgi:carbamoyl-phosphate synthase large subunit